MAIRTKPERTDQGPENANPAPNGTTSSLRFSLFKQPPYPQPMPEMHVHLRWPDGSQQRIYSPSLVITDHLEEGESYAVPDLVTRLQTALDEASNRVQASYGFPCSRAAASKAAIEQRATAYDTGEVTVEAFER
jgi:uncharacterized repeat protein (TIGR04042 family)